jgi:hypothetical protein
MPAFRVPIGLVLLGSVTWSVGSLVIELTRLFPVTYLASAVAAIAIAVSAARLLSRRATRIDRMVALRSE